jgi:outer membrane protein OmpA-like peptidoglycan-associated protein
MLWAFVCWRWYVCGIKEACQTETKTAAVPDITPAIEQDTAVAYIPPEGTNISANSTQPNSSTSADNKTPDRTSANTPPGSTVSNAINITQVEDFIDKMVIYFPYNSTRKEDDEAMDEYLSRLAERLIASGGTAYIAGHTDFVGDAAGNKQFGLKRAAGIRTILTKKGVPADHIKIRSYGDTRPVASNDTPRGRYLNRRAEITYKE